MAIITFTKLMIYCVVLTYKSTADDYDFAQRQCPAIVAASMPFGININIGIASDRFAFKCF